MSSNLFHSFKMVILSSATLSLVGCFGGGTSMIDTASALDAAKVKSAEKALSKEKLDNIEGTIGYAMDVDETVYSSSDELTSSLGIGKNDGRVGYGAKPKVTFRKNFIGGVDMNFDGRKISLTEKEAVSNSDDAWFRQYGTGSTVFSLSLWNAGRGDREAFTANAAGQNYHKIAGYETNDATMGRSRGHIVFGERTPLETVAALEKTATFDGYFSANIVGDRLGNANQDIGSTSDIVSGGLELTANFDTNTVSGISTGVLRRPAGAIEFTEEVFDVKFDAGAIKNNGSGGVVYAGSISSAYKPLDGASYSGSFFGDKAQEAAGVITGDTTNGEGAIDSGRNVDGFFTAAR